MKREIRFRAWNKKNKTMHEVKEIGWNLADYSRFHVALKNIDNGYYCCGYSFKDVELMQFIGSHDINDKPIYESDNLKCKDLYTGLEFTGTVEFQDCSFVIKNDCVTHYRWMDYEVEVVGNVWEGGK